MLETHDASQVYGSDSEASPPAVFTSWLKCTDFEVFLHEFDVFA